MSRRSGQGGTTLIEVLTVIVVLLVGIFAAIRLFPIGFTVNQRAAESDTATRLATAEIDRFSTGAANLMDAIAPGWIDSSGVFHFDTTATPDDLTTAAGAPAGSVLTDPYYFSDVNRFRHVVGETVRVPAPSTAGGETGGVYLLSLGPIVLVPSGGSTFSGINVYGGPLQRVPGLTPSDSDAASKLTGPSQYGIYYGDGTTPAQILIYPATFPRIFRLTYSSYNASLAITSTVIASFPVAATPVGTSPAWLTLPDAQLVPESDVVSRAFNQITTAAAWTTDPYEFRVMYTNVAPDVNVGALAFNPTGRDYMEQTATGTQPLSAHIDYDVLDWRILREDRTMPAATPYVVRLSVPNIKKLGDLQEDQTPYPGMFRLAGGPEILIYNVATGGQVPPSAYTVDYAAAIVTFTGAFGSANAGTAFRFLYKAQGEWGLQLQKSAAIYTQNPSAAALQFSDYYLDTSANAAGQPLYMYFSSSEAGKTFSVRDLTYAVHHASGTPQDETVSLHNVSFQISASRADFVSIGARSLARVAVATPAAGTDTINWPATAPTPNLTIVPVVGVQGVSSRVRVIWSGGTTINQSATGTDVVRTTWRHRDIDTSLTRVTK